MLTVSGSATRFLFGEDAIGSNVDEPKAGSAKAFPFMDETSGTASEITVYVASRTGCDPVGRGSVFGPWMSSHVKACGG